MSGPIHPTLPSHVHRSLLYTSVSIPAVHIGSSVPLFWILHISIVTVFCFFKEKKHRISQAQIKFMSCPTSPWQASYPKNRHSSEPEGCVEAECLFSLGPWASLHFTLSCSANVACCVGVQLFTASHYSPLDFYMVRMVSPLLFLIFTHRSVGKESACNAGDPGSIPVSGKIPWRRK